MRAVPGCFLQITSAMHEILHLPSSKDCARSLFPKLYMVVLFEISFILECVNRGCFVLSIRQETEHVWPSDSLVRCCIPTASSLPRARSQGQGQGSPCDTRFAVHAGVR